MLRLPRIINGHEEVHSFLKMDLYVAAPAKARLFWHCCWIGGSLLSVPLCLLPSALLVILSVLSVALSVLYFAPLFVLSFLSVVLAVLPVCLSVFSHMAGSLNKIKGFAFVLAKVSYETSLKPQRIYGHVGLITLLSVTKTCLLLLHKFPVFMLNSLEYILPVRSVVWSYRKSLHPQ